jgi:hypothetical protein
VPQNNTSSQAENEFQNVILKLDNSDKLAAFMNENFILDINNVNDTAISPKELLMKKQGGIQDFAVFAVSVLDSHKFETGIIRYKFTIGKNHKTGINTIVVFGENNTPKYFYFDEGKVKISPYSGSFNDLFHQEEKRLNAIITEYAAIYPGTLNLIPREWRKR